MVRLSQDKIKLLKDDILSILYESKFQPLFTNQIATDLRRDNEFTKLLLLELEKEGVVERVKKNKLGKAYLSRIKWMIPLSVRQAYEGNK